jgi:hypothetical protein
MSDTRRKDINWKLNVSHDGGVTTLEAQLAVLMDIRDELKRLNNRLYCTEVGEIPRILRRISANTHKPKRRRSARPAAS